MSIFSSVADMFRPTTQVSTQVPTVTPMGQANPGAAGQVPPSGTSLPNTEAPPANPLDAFTEMWQHDPKSQPAVDPLSTPLFNTDPAKIAAAAGKIDFLAQVNPELVTKAMAGNDPQAFMQVMNAVAQRTLATATQLNAATIEQATSRNNERFSQALPSKVKQIQLNSLQSENPALQHPASQPLLQMVRAQIQMKEPGLSAADINKRAESYLAGFATQLSTPPVTETQRQQASGTDWEAWASTP